MSPRDDGDHDGQRPGALPPGHGRTAADHGLLRTPPPARALRWAADAIGPGARAGDVWALEGGTSSAVHAVDIQDQHGGTHPLVLRRFVRADALAREPDAPREEAAALNAAGACRLRTPGLVALDPDGTDAGTPAILMTRLAGSPDWDPVDMEAYLGALAGALPTIHATPLPPSSGIRVYAPYEPHPRRPPSWTADPGLWRQAIALFEGPPPPGRRCFVHRDYHPGNVLWDRGALVGVVDWEDASVGSPGADVGHCRANLAGPFGLAAADRFRDLYTECSGALEHQPYWDVVAALGGYDESDLDEQDERFLAHVLSRG